MTKKIPPQSPLFAWTIAEASYQRNLTESNTYLHKYFPHANVLAEESFRGWRVILIQKENQLSVAFRGTDPWHNWGGNIRNEFLGPSSTIVGEMEKRLNQWEKIYQGKITLFSAHSGGATYANAVRKMQDIARVYFNGHHSLSCTNSWNLVTQQDQLTHFDLVVSPERAEFIKNLIPMGEGGHGLDGFESLLQGKDWNQIEERAKNSHLHNLACCLQSQSAAQEFSKKLEAGEIILGLEDLKTLERSTHAQAEMLKAAEKSSAFLQNLGEASQAFASKVLNHMVEKQNHEERFWNLMEQNHRLKRRSDQIAEEFKKPSKVLSSLPLKEMLQTHFLPQTGLSLAQEIDQLTQVYHQQMKNILSKLQNTHDLDKALKAQFERIDQLDTSQQTMYHELLKTQKKIGKQYGRLQLISSGIHFVTSVTPCHIAAKAIASLAEQVLQLTHTWHQGMIQKKIKRHVINLEANLGTKETLASLSQTNQTMQDLFIQRSVSLLGDLTTNPSQFVPSQHREQLTQLMNHLKFEIGECSESIQKSEQELHHKKEEIAQKEIQLNNIRQVKGGKKGNKKRDLEAQEQALLSQYEQDKAEIQKQELLLKGIQDKQQSLRSSLDMAAIEREKAERYSSFRDHIWNVIHKKSEPLNANSPSTEELRQELNSAFELYHKVRLSRGTAAHTVFSTAGNIAKALGYKGDSVRALSACYHLWDHISYWKDVAIPGANLMIDSYKQGKGALDIGMCVTHYLTPAMGTLLTGIQLVQAIRSICHKTTPAQKPLHQLMMEEINKQLCLLDKGLRQVIHHETTTVTQEIAKLRELLNLSTEYLSNQIQEFRQENTDQHAEKNLNDFNDKIKNYSIIITNKYQKYELTIIKFISKLNKENLLIDFTNWFNKSLQNMQNDLFVYCFDTPKINIDALRLMLQTDEYDYLHVQYTTTLLALKINTIKGMPNWRILTDVTKGFTSLISAVVENDCTSSAVRSDKLLQSRITEMCENLLNLNKKVMNFRFQIKNLIIKLYQLKNAFFEKNGPGAGNNAEARSNFLKTLYQKTVTEYNWGSLKNHLVGDKKFAFHTELFSQFSQRMHSLRKIVEPHYVTVNKVCLEFSIVMKKMCTLGLWEVTKCMEELKHDAFSYEWNKNWRQIRTITDLFFDFSHYGLIQKDLSQSHRAQTVEFCFDLQKREIVWLNPPAPAHSVPFLKMRIGADLSFSAEPSLFHNIDNLRTIHATKGLPYQDYTLTLTQLITNYETVLKALANITPPPPPNHPLATLFQGGEIVPSAHSHGLPLVFPKAFLRRLETFLNPTMRYSHALGMGTFVPYYTFSTETQELIIHYQITHPSYQKTFAQFKVASFDPLTIASFKPDLTSNANFDPSELLIQALYGNFANFPLGLPTYPSIFLPGFKQVIPHEQPFMGLYNLWQQHPKKILAYNAAEMSPESPPEECLSFRIAPRLGPDYIEVVSEIYKKNKSLVQQEKEYQKLYTLLHLMILLYSKLPPKEVLENLENAFEIFSPPRLSVLYDLPSLRALSEEEIDGWMEELFLIPSEHLSNAEALQEKLYDILDWIQKEEEESKSSTLFS